LWRRSGCASGGRAKRAALDTYRQDSICRTWECLADAIYCGGRERMKKDCPTYIERGKCKREWAVNIGRHMRPDANVSPSFRYFLSEIRKRIVRPDERKSCGDRRLPFPGHRLESRPTDGCPL